MRYFYWTISLEHEETVNIWWWQKQGTIQHCMNYIKQFFYLHMEHYGYVCLILICHKTHKIQNDSCTYKVPCSAVHIVVLFRYRDVCLYLLFCACSVCVSLNVCLCACLYVYLFYVSNAAAIFCLFLCFTSCSSLYAFLFAFIYQLLWP